MASPIQIVNRALALLGSSSIADLGEGTKKADIAGLSFPMVRDRVLDDADWTFATKRITLPLHLCKCTCGCACATDCVCEYEWGVKAELCV